MASYESAGYSSRQDFERAKREKDYNRWGSAWTNWNYPTDSNFRSINSEYAKLYADARNSGWSKSAKGPFAKLLVEVGLRDPSETRPVGESL